MRNTLDAYRKTFAEEVINKTDISRLLRRLRNCERRSRELKEFLEKSGDDLPDIEEFEKVLSLGKTNLEKIQRAGVSVDSYQQLKDEVKGLELFLEDKETVLFPQDYYERRVRELMSDFDRRLQRANKTIKEGTTSQFKEGVENHNLLVEIENTEWRLNNLKEVLDSGKTTARKMIVDLLQENSIESTLIDIENKLDSLDSKSKVIFDEKTYFEKNIKEVENYKRSLAEIIHGHYTDLVTGSITAERAKGDPAVDLARLKDSLMIDFNAVLKDIGDYLQEKIFKNPPTSSGLKSSLGSVKEQYLKRLKDKVKGKEYTTDSLDYLAGRDKGFDYDKILELLPSKRKDRQGQSTERSVLRAIVDSEGGLLDKLREAVSYDPREMGVWFGSATPDSPPDDLVDYVRETIDKTRERLMKEVKEFVKANTHLSLNQGDELDWIQNPSFIATQLLTSIRGDISEEEAKQILEDARIEYEQALKDGVVTEYDLQKLRSEVLSKLKTAILALEAKNKTIEGALMVPEQILRTKEERDNIFNIIREYASDPIRRKVGVIPMERKAYVERLLEYPGSFVVRELNRIINIPGELFKIPRFDDLPAISSVATEDELLYSDGLTEEEVLNIVAVYFQKREDKIKDEFYPTEFMGELYLVPKYVFDERLKAPLVEEFARRTSDLIEGSRKKHFEEMANKYYKNGGYPGLEKYLAHYHRLKLPKLLKPSQLNIDVTGKLAIESRQKANIFKEEREKDENSPFEITPEVEEELTNQENEDVNEEVLEDTPETQDIKDFFELNNDTQSQAWSAYSGRYEEEKKAPSASRAKELVEKAKFGESVSRYTTLILKVLEYLSKRPGDEYSHIKPLLELDPSQVSNVLREVLESQHRAHKNDRNIPSVKEILNLTRKGEYKQFGYFFLTPIVEKLEKIVSGDSGSDKETDLDFIKSILEYLRDSGTTELEKYDLASFVTEFIARITPEASNEFIEKYQDNKRVGLTIFRGHLKEALDFLEKSDVSVKKRWGFREVLSEAPDQEEAQEDSLLLSTMKSDPEVVDTLKRYDLEVFAKMLPRYMDVARFTKDYSQDKEYAIESLREQVSGAKELVERANRKIQLEWGLIENEVHDLTKEFILEILKYYSSKIDGNFSKTYDPRRFAEKFLTTQKDLKQLAYFYQTNKARGFKEFSERITELTKWLEKEKKSVQRDWGRVLESSKRQEKADFEQKAFFVQAYFEHHDENFFELYDLDTFVKKFLSIEKDNRAAEVAIQTGSGDLLDHEVREVLQLLATSTSEKTKQEWGFKSTTELESVELNEPTAKYYTSDDQYYEETDPNKKS